MTDADKVMHPHFGTDPTEIRINPAIRTGIPDDFQLKFWRWWRFALSVCSCYLLPKTGTTQAYLSHPTYKSGMARAVPRR